MKFSVPHNALVAIVDGAHAIFFTNTAAQGIKLEKAENYSPSENDHRGAPPLPPETSDRDKNEAEFASHVADELYRRVHGGKVKALVLIADPQTLGQLRPDLHEEVTSIITGELPKTLTNLTTAEIEKHLSAELN